MKLGLLLYWLLLLAVVASTLVATSAPSAKSKGNSGDYDTYCNQIVTFAKQAATEYNRGNAVAAQMAISNADKSFESAIAIDPENPQAYLFAGTFKTNTHEYEVSVQYFQKAIDLLPPSDKQNRARIEKSIHNANYKKYSMLRDKAYDNGNGNITLAFEFAKEQLRYSPQPHQTNHELATLAAMLCEYDDDAATTNSMCHQSHVYYRTATFSTLSHYTVARSQSAKKTAKQRCMRSDIFLGVWDVEKYNKKDGRLTVDEPVKGLYINTLKGKYDIHGADGLITAEDNKGDCAVFVQSEDFYFNVAQNLFPPSKPKYPRGELDMDDPIFSLAQFAGSTFYHWIAEGLPKLIAFRFYYPEASKTRILIPAAPTKDGKVFPSFITESLKLLQVDENMVIPYMGTGMRGGGEKGAKITTVTWPAQPCPGEVFSENVMARRMCAALPHPKPLKMARDALSVAATITATTAAPKKYILVARRGDAVTSRQFNETALIERIIATLPEAGYYTFQVVEFYAHKHSLANALNLFKKATLVIGAHGGALSNLIVCPPKTGVIEIGFKSVSARHYEHMSAVLGLNYRRVRVKEDPLHRALGAPTIDVDFDLVVNETLSLLPPPSEEDELLKNNPDLRRRGGVASFDKEAIDRARKGGLGGGGEQEGRHNDDEEGYEEDDEEKGEDEEL